MIQAIRAQALIPMCLTLAACGAPAPAASVESGAPNRQEAPTPKWRDATTKEERVAFMKAHVLPTMSRVFEESGMEHVTCKTCHGPQLGHPADFLPHLTLQGGKFTAEATHPEQVAFMKTKVVPAMADALGEPPYDPVTHQGFGCAGCHTIEVR